MWKYGVWIPHELSPHQLQLRVDTCTALMTSHRNYQWLHNLITGDEKWVLYVNHMRKRQWLGTGQTGIAKPQNDLYPRKIMLSVWWGVRRITHWEVLPNGCNITADLYYQQLDRVAAKLQEKQDRVNFLHDNARPHVAKSTREKLPKLGWIMIPHHQILLTWPYGLSFLPFSIWLFTWKKLRQCERPQSAPGYVFCTEVLGTSTNAGFFPWQSVVDKLETAVEYILLKASCTFQFKK